MQILKFKKSILEIHILSVEPNQTKNSPRGNCRATQPIMRAGCKGIKFLNKGTMW